MHTRYRNYFLFLGGFLSLFLWACSNKELSNSEAKVMITKYLETSPVYESTNLKLGKIKLNIRKDSTDLKHYKELEAEGYIQFSEEQRKKKFLSKDSVWRGSIKLTDKALEYIIKQSDKKAEVKTLDYQLHSSDDLKIIKKKNKRAVVNALLYKTQTPFYFINPQKNSNADFVTKKFTFKYSEDKGWVLKD